MSLCCTFSGTSGSVFQRYIPWYLYNLTIDIFLIFISTVFISLFSFSVPDAPTDITLIESTTDSLTLNWTQGGNPPDNCTVTVNDVAENVDADCTAHRVVISGLPSAGKEYEITITAILGSKNSSSKKSERTSKSHIICSHKKTQYNTNKS